jgi:DNA-binding transcriptional MerR regulator
MIGDMTIGQLARCTGLPVRTLRFDADEGVLPEADRTESGYRLFGPEAVARGRLVRTLRELGVGLADIKRVRAPGRLRGSTDSRARVASDATESLRECRSRRASAGLDGPTQRVVPAV